jgi:PAS domain S-box-containing protein
LAALSSDWYWEQGIDFRFVRVDSKLQELTGIPIADYLGKTRWEQQALNLTQADWDLHRAVIDAHEEFRNFEIQRVNLKGQVRWAAVSGTPILDAHGQFCGYRGVGSDITERTRLEQERLDLSLHIEELSRRLVQAQEQVRRRFSRELHDRTSPNLAALRINLDIIAMATPAERGTRNFADRVEDTKALIWDTTLSIREICAELHPPVLDIGGLLCVVQSYAEQFTKRTGLPVRVNCLHGEVRLAPDLELSLFRIVQEALTNCAKHANARRVTVSLQLDSSPLVLTVVDDGVGFDLDRVMQTRHLAGMGLLNMRETAEFAGGRFRVESTPGRGTRICVEI